MITHQRQKIREAIVNILIDRTDAKKFVKPNFTAPIFIEDLPAILIYTRSEDIEEFSISPRELKRTMQLVIEIVSAGTNDINLQDQLDTISEQVEQLLSQDDTLDCTVEDIILNSVEFEFIDEGNKPTGSARLIYSVIYLTEMPKEREELSKAKTVKVDWNTNKKNKGLKGEEIIEAKDDLDLPIE